MLESRLCFSSNTLSCRCSSSPPSLPQKPEWACLINEDAKFPPWMWGIICVVIVGVILLIIIVYKQVRKKKLQPISDQESEMQPKCGNTESTRNLVNGNLSTGHAN
nr:uncharacterized protein LOC129256159 [Lytechinus pictus]